MKLDHKAIQYILLLLILVIGFCAYQFGYVKYLEKANSVKASNKSVEARIAELNEKETYREEWTKVIGETDSKIKEILAKYGPGNTPEKSIMFIRNLEETAQMIVSSIAFNSDNVMFSSSDVDENGNPKVELDSTFISINYSTSYEGLKACMDYINDYPERMNVSGFTASYNQENGLLSGNMTINLYGVRDADHTYVEPYVGGIDLGTENIFGATGTLDLNNEAGEGTGENAAANATGNNTVNNSTENTTENNTAENNAD